MSKKKKSFNEQTIGDRVRERRRRAGLTQRQLAAMIGVSGGTIGSLESERDYVTSRPTIIAISQALGCDPDWLATGIGDALGRGKVSPEELQEMRKKRSEWNAALNSMPKELRAAIIAQIHYRDMETILEMALKTRTPMPDTNEEQDFQYMLRKWGNQRKRGRAAIMLALKMLENLGYFKEAADRTLSRKADENSPDL